MCGVTVQSCSSYAPIIQCDKRDYLKRILENVCISSAPSAPLQHRLIIKELQKKQMGADLFICSHLNMDYCDV